MKHRGFDVLLWLLVLLLQRVAVADKLAEPVEYMTFYEVFQLDNAANGANRQIARGWTGDPDGKYSFDGFIEYIADQKTSAGKNHYFQHGVITDPTNIEDTAQKWKANDFDVRYSHTTRFIDSDALKWGQAKDPHHGLILEWLGERIQTLRLGDTKGKNEPDPKNTDDKSPISRLRNLFEKIHEIRLAKMAPDLKGKLEDPDNKEWDKLRSYWKYTPKMSFDKTYEVPDSRATLEAARQGNPDYFSGTKREEKMVNKLAKLMAKLETEEQSEKDMHWRIIRRLATLRGSLEAARPCK